MLVARVVPLLVFCKLCVLVKKSGAGKQCGGIAALLVNQELGLGASSIELPDAAHCFDRMFLAVTLLKRLQQKVVAVVTVAAGLRVGSSSSSSSRSCSGSSSGKPSRMSQQLRRFDNGNEAFSHLFYISSCNIPDGSTCIQWSRHTR